MSWLSSLFGGDDNDAAQKAQDKADEQAEQARKDAAAKQKRIDAGAAKIKGLFHGTEKLKTVKNKFDWSKFKAPTDQKLSGTAVAGLPTGYKYNYTPGAAVSAPGDSQVSDYAPSNAGNEHGAYRSRDGVVTRRGAAAAAPAGTWAIIGPDGKLYKSGDALTTTGQVGTGVMEGGYGDKWFDDFKKSITDVYMPKVSEQYADADRELKYRLGRAGLGTSSTQIDKTKDLVAQNLSNQGDVNLKAETMAGDEKRRINDLETAALNQLYATEDPTTAMSTATNYTKSITPAATDLAPLGDLFDVATIGAAKFGQGYNNAGSLGRIKKLGSNAGGYIAQGS